MKATNVVRGTKPQTEVLPSADKTSPTPAKSARGSRSSNGVIRALQSLPTAFSKSGPPAPHAPGRSTQSPQNADAHRSGDIAAAIKHMRGGEATRKPSPVHLSSTTGCWQVPADQVATPSHSRSARRLGELLHEERP